MSDTSEKSLQPAVEAARRAKTARRHRFQIVAPFGAVETSTMRRAPGVWRVGWRLLFILASGALAWAAALGVINALT